jgi:hypothetical protein
MTCDRETIGLAARATLHCATGCVAGEVAGLAIGVALGLGVWASMGLATALAFVFGLTLASVPLARSQGIALSAALGMIWLGEVASIAAMEVAMNAVDYALGGVSAGSLAAPRFWWALMVAIPFGYVAALPVNYAMIRRGVGHHHH